jgi:hypothetical protein
MGPYRNLDKQIRPVNIYFTVEISGQALLPRTVLHVYISLNYDATY